jgi:hypothetical protein
MPINSYDTAFEQATNDRAEIRVAIENLLTRGEMLDKLLECLAPFVSSPKPAGETSGASNELVSAGHSEEGHSHEHHEG